ncbi:MAG: PQQ-binding-like beta-propeller repeat protein, partial [Burkholderiaceae bacterium]
MRMSARFSTACLILLATGLTGCGSLNPFADPPRTKPAELTDFPASAKLTQAWQASLGAKSVGSPVLVTTSAQQLRLLATAGERVSVIDPTNGAVLARAEAPATLSTGAGSDGELIVAATRAGDVMAWSMDGKEAWRAPLNAEILARPAVTDGTAAVLTTDGRLVGFDSATGKRRWVVQRPAPALALRIASPIVPVRGGFLVGMAGGRMLAVGARD